MLYSTFLDPERGGDPTTLANLMQVEENLRPVKPTDPPIDQCTFSTLRRINKDNFVCYLYDRQYRRPVFDRIPGNAQFFMYTRENVCILYDGDETAYRELEPILETPTRGFFYEVECYRGPAYPKVADHSCLYHCPFTQHKDNMMEGPHAGLTVTKPHVYVIRYILHPQ